MAANITLSAGVRQNLLALQNTASLLGATQNRLATGKKVNSALDNPTNFFTSSALASRASDLSKLLDSMANGISTVKPRQPDRDLHPVRDHRGNRHFGAAGRLVESHVVLHRSHRGGLHRRSGHLGRRGHRYGQRRSGQREWQTRLDHQLCGHGLQRQRQRRQRI
jgi:hypothetical protein